MGQNPVGMYPLFIMEIYDILYNVYRYMYTLNNSVWKGPQEATQANTEVRPAFSFIKNFSCLCLQSPVLFVPIAFHWDHRHWPVMASALLGALRVNIQHGFTAVTSWFLACTWSNKHKIPQKWISGRLYIISQEVSMENLHEVYGGRSGQVMLLQFISPDRNHVVFLICPWFFLVFTYSFRHD